MAMGFLVETEVNKFIDTHGPRGRYLHMMHTTRSVHELHYEGAARASSWGFFSWLREIVRSAEAACCAPWATASILRISLGGLMAR